MWDDKGVENFLDTLICFCYDIFILTKGLFMNDNNGWMDIIRRYQTMIPNELDSNGVDWSGARDHILDNLLNRNNPWVRRVDEEGSIPTDTIEEGEEMGFEEEDEFYESGWDESGWDDEIEEDEDEHLNWDSGIAPHNTHRGWDLEDLPRPRVNPFTGRPRGGNTYTPPPVRERVVTIDETATDLDDDYLKRLGVK